MAPKKFVAKIIKDLKLKAEESKKKISTKLCDVPKKITVSSDFCGYGTAALALHYLGVCFRTVMCSECDVDVAELLRCTHRYINQPLQPENFSADMVTRPHVEADLYIGTSPCKDFSTAGANKGTSGKHGILWWKQAERIVVERPRAFLLENVPGLQRVHRRDLEATMDIFRSAGYVVLEKIMLTSEHGLAQKRARLYLAGVRMDSLSQTVTLDDLWPKPLQHEVNLKMFLEERPIADLPVVDEKQECETFRSNLRWASEALGADRLRDFGVVIDVGGGRDKFVSSQLMSTITSSRAAASAYYLPWRRQRMSMVEMARLQGMPDDLCRSMLEIVRAPVFGAAVGNAVSLPVIERILGKLLPLANLVEGPVADFWNDLMPLPTTNAWKYIEKRRARR